MDSISAGRTAARKILWLLLLSAALLVTGCAGHRSQPAPVIPPPSLKITPDPVRNLLETQLKDWQGVPYRLGGSTRKGVDCSAFIQLTFQERFGLSLPRTTLEQALVGTPIGPAALASGDLVFFRTGPDKRHVGIYLGGGRFMHVSYTQGVIGSSLSESYWRRHFWQARRVLPPSGRMVAGE